jgi:uncharacterized protein
MHVLHRSVIPTTAAELAAWHFNPGAFERLAPPWDNVRLVHTTGPLANGSVWTIRMPLAGPLAVHHVALLRDVRPGEQFQDVQLRGLFTQWEHTHRFLPHGAAAMLEDELTVRGPLGAFGSLLAGWKVHAELRRLFAYRHEVTRRDLRRHFGEPRLRIAVTGSRGFIGEPLVNFLTAGGHQVVRLVRDDKPPLYDDGTQRVPWEPTQPLPPQYLEGLDAVIHLAAAPIATRWTARAQARIRDSRTTPTRFLVESARAAGVRVFLSASGVGIYGDQGDADIPDDGPVGSGFLAQVCQDWETAAQHPSLRVVLLRIGVVLSPQGAALGKQRLPFQCGLGAVLGHGRQYVPWIGMDDTLAAMLHIIRTPSLAGPVNLVAPDPVPNREFADTLARVLRRPRWLRLHANVLKLLVGDVAQPALLNSMRARPRRLLQTGFTFDGRTLEGELRHLLGRLQSDHQPADSRRYT